MTNCWIFNLGYAGATKGTKPEKLLKEKKIRETERVETSPKRILYLLSSEQQKTEKLRKSEKCEKPHRFPTENEITLTRRGHGRKRKTKQKQREKQVKKEETGYRKKKKS